MAPMNVNLLNATGRYSNATSMRMRLEMKGAAKQRQQPETTMRMKDGDRGAKHEPPGDRARRVDHAQTGPITCWR